MVELPGFVGVGEILKSGVYALLWRGQVVYIGKSKSMLIRIYTHRSNSRGKVPSWLPVKGITFDDVHIRPCHVDLLDELEYEMINLFKPRYNTQLKTPGPARPPTTLTINGVTLHLNQTTRPAPQIERRI